MSLLLVTPRAQGDKGYEASKYVGLVLVACAIILWLPHRIHRMACSIY